MSARLTQTAIALAATALVIAGCSGGGQAPSEDGGATQKASRQAAEAVTPSAPASPTAAADASPDPVEGDALGASRQGVFVCFTNAVSRPVAVTWVQSDTNEGNRSIAPGSSICGEGRTSKNADLTASLRLPGVDNALDWSFSNPLMGWPTVTTNANEESDCSGSTMILAFGKEGTAGSASVPQRCWTREMGSAQTETVRMPAGAGDYQFTVIRRPDDHHAMGGVDISGNRWKRFHVTIDERDS